MDIGKKIALGIVGLLTLYFLSGAIFNEEETVQPAEMQFEIPSVSLSILEPNDVIREIEIHGKTQANRFVTLRSEVKSTVDKIVKEEGELVEKGQVILTLDKRDWPARLQQAEAALKEAEMGLEAVRRLVKQGINNQGDLARAESAVASANAQKIAIKKTLDSMEVRAPFTGVVEARMIELGDYVREGDQLVEVIDYSPTLVVGEVSEREAYMLRKGQEAEAEMIGGETVTGQIRYVASRAKESTRTFKVEMEIDQNLGVATSGVTSRIKVKLDPVKAVFISPAYWNINDAGQLGVKSINEQNKVIFKPIEIVKAEASGAWVSGIEDDPRVITQGQGFVEVGETVKPVLAKPPYETAISKDASNGSSTESQSEQINTDLNATSSVNNP